MLLKIGDVEVWRLLDMNGPFMSPHSLFPNAGPEVAAEIARDAPGSIEAATGKLIIPIQGFLLKTPRHVVLVDACVGNHKNNGYAGWAHRDDTRFMAALTASGTTPEEVDFVLCTHLHPDHVGWNTKLENGQWVPTFPNARYLLPAGDLDDYAADPTPSYTESVLPVVAAGLAEPVSGAHQLDDEIDLIPTHGHSPGHVSVRIRSGGREAVITGDALHTAAQCRHPQWHFRFDADPVQAEQSRRKLLETVSESGARMIGSHFQLPSVGRVEATPQGFRWRAN